MRSSSAVRSGSSSTQIGWRWTPSCRRSSGSFLCRSWKTEIRIWPELSPDEMFEVEAQAAEKQALRLIVMGVLVSPRDGQSLDAANTRWIRIIPAVAQLKG